MRNFLESLGALFIAFCTILLVCALYFMLLASVLAPFVLAVWFIVDAFRS